MKRRFSSFFLCALSVCLTVGVFPLAPAVAPAAGLPKYVAGLVKDGDDSILGMFGFSWTTGVGAFFTPAVSEMTPEEYRVWSEGAARVACGGLRKAEFKLAAATARYKTGLGTTGATDFEREQQQWEARREAVWESLAGFDSAPVACGDFLGNFNEVAYLTGTAEARAETLRARPGRTGKDAALPPDPSGWEGRYALLEIPDAFGEAVVGRAKDGGFTLEIHTETVWLKNDPFYCNVELSGVLENDVLVFID